MMWLALAFAEPVCPAVDVDDSDVRWQTSVVVVHKEARTLGVYARGEPVACFSVALAAGYVDGHKQQRGDLRTPEGWQRISDRPWSAYYGALSVHYPDAEDARRGLQAGWIDQSQHDRIAAADKRGSLPPRDTRLGGDIVIHGGGGTKDWTLGCVGMENDDIDALRALLPTDKRGWVLILP